MIPEHQILRAQRHIHHVAAMMDEAVRLDDVAARLMAVQRHWDDPDRPLHLLAALQASRTVWDGIQAALAAGTLPMPPDVQHNLLILSVYADSKINMCESAPDADTLGSLIALTRTLAGSLKEWREAA